MSFFLPSRLHHRTITYGRESISASEMTYIVSGGALNSTNSTRKHHFELPNKTSHLTDCNFMQRMLFLETY